MGEKDFDINDLKAWFVYDKADLACAKGLCRDKDYNCMYEVSCGDRKREVLKNLGY